MHQIPRASAILVLVIGLILGVAAPVVAAPTVQNVSFAQIDWEIEPGLILLADSRWGHVTVDYTPGQDMYYLNIVANDQSGGADQWIVRNFLLSAAETDPNPNPASTTFDLGLLGGIDGVDFTNLEYYVHVDILPALSLPPAQGPSVPNTPVGDLTFLTGGGAEFDGDVFTDPGDPQLPVLAPIAKVWPKTGGSDTKRTDVPNIEQEKNQCYPAAVANSFEWLSDYWNLGLEDDAEDIVDDLDTAMGRAPCGTVKHKELIEGKLKYIKDKNLPVVVHFMSTWVGSDVTTGGRTAKRDGGTPTWDYIKKELEKGQDVELTYQRDAGGAHGVTVTGVYEKKDGTKGVHFQDDTRQGDDTAGTSSTSSDIGNNGGSMNVLSRPKNKVTGVFVESPTVDAMIDRILKLIGEIQVLLDAIVDNGYRVDDQQADKLVQLTRALDKAAGHLIPAVEDTQAGNSAAKQATLDLKATTTVIYEQAKDIRDLVIENPGQPIPEQIEELGGHVDGARSQSSEVDASLFRSACCLQEEGGCVNQQAPDQCDSIGGVYQGQGATCEDVACPLPQACCDKDGSCFDAPVRTCKRAGGASQGAGSRCVGATFGDGVDLRCKGILKNRGAETSDIQRR